jgi:hypothetical protein
MLSLLIEKKRYYRVYFLLSISFISCLFVVFDLAFKKPYHPQIVANQLNLFPQPLMIVIGYKDSLDIALGLSYAFALEHIRQDHVDDTLVFLDRTEGYNLLWHNLTNLSSSALNLWVFAPELTKNAYPLHLTLAHERDCVLDPNQHYRVGIPYQGYHCSGNRK